MSGNCWRIAAWVALFSIVAAAGCPGTNVLQSGNSTVSFEIALQGTTDQSYDCILWRMSGFRIRPLDGICTGGDNPGGPCFNQNDCPGGGTCEGSSSVEVLGNEGVLVPTSSERGNLTGSSCEPTDEGGGVCGSPFPQPACQTDADCQVVEYPGNTCGPSNTCALPFFPLVNCASDADCTSIEFPGNTCSGNPFTNLVQSGTFTPPSPTVLSPGLYRISALNVGGVALYTDNPQALSQCDSTYPVQNFYDAEERQFFVTGEGVESIRFAINLDLMEDLLPAASPPPDPANACTAFQNNLTSILEIQTGD